MLRLFIVHLILFLYQKRLDWLFGQYRTLTSLLSKNNTSIIKGIEMCKSK